jgi:leader peptidase (prepilin peptidase)/N-methyltransferase
MTVVLMALVGIAVGFLLDEAIARLAREPYERGEIEEDDLRLKKDPSLALNSEAGAFDMPQALTTGSPYRRIVVIAASAALFALAALRYGDEPGNMLIVAAYVAVLVVCTGTDVLAYRVPNVVTYPAIVAAIIIGTAMPDATLRNVWAGGLIVGGTFLAMSIATRGGMGMGDVKLATFVGFALGLVFGVYAMLITAITGGVIAVLLMVTRIRDRKDPIPYAPFIAIGAIWVLMRFGAAFIEL